MHNFCGFEGFLMRCGNLLPLSNMPRRVKKTRNAATLTESQFWGKVRSALRREFRYWKPALKAKLAARRKYVGDNKRQKWEYSCAHCSKWFPDKEIQIDHIVPVGTLKTYKDLAGFLKRLTPETGFQVLCKDCHKEKTRKERENAIQD